MIRRHLTDVLVLESTRNPVVTLTGPRQSGKTTLVKAVFSDHRYVSLERPDQRRMALEDPLGFLAGLGDRVLLDEVQKVPELLSYIQVAVDEDPRPGRFILTGSQNLLLMQDVSQTLAGRTAILTLQPFSLAELRGTAVLDPESLGDETSGPPPTMELWQTIFTGFFPPIHDRGLDPTRWLGDYHKTYVERDLRDVLKVMDLDAFDRFVRLCAGRTATELNLSALAADAGISQPTAKNWLTALRTGSLVTLLPPHHVSYRKRLRKRPRLHFLDTGLVCYLLGIQDAMSLSNHPLRGAIFESFVVSELIKGFEHAGKEPHLYSWRDATGHEVDVLVQQADGLLPVEIKSGMTVVSDMMKSLRWWLDLPGNSSNRGVLVHGGVQRQSRSGIEVLPWYLK